MRLFQQPASLEDSARVDHGSESCYLGQAGARQWVISPATIPQLTNNFHSKLTPDHADSEEK